MKKFLLIVVLNFTIGTLSVIAATKPSVKSSIPTSVTPAAYSIAKEPRWVTHIEAPKAKEAVPGRVARILLTDTQLQIGAGEEHFYQHIAITPLQKAGLEQASQIRIDFNPEYERLTLHDISISRAGKRINKLDRSRIKIIQREEDLEQRLYDGMLTASIILDDIRVNDVVNYSYSINGSNPVFGDKFAASVGMGGRSPISLIHVRLVAPATRQINAKLYNSSIQPKITMLGANQETIWRIENSPIISAEDDYPVWYKPYPWLQLTEYNDWPQVQRWAEELYRVNEPLSAELLAQIQTWKDKTADTQERVKLALNFVQQDIRYFGMELGESSHRPADPSQIFKQRHGDCKDKTLLLITILNEFGVKAYPALVSTRSDRAIGDWLPSPRVFDHVIAMAEIDGETYWLDGTRQYQTGTLKNLRYVSYGKALIVGRNDHQLVDMKITNSDTPNLLVKEHFEVKDYKDKVAATVKVIYSGATAEYMRSLFANNSIEEITQSTLNDHARRYPKISSVGAVQKEDDLENNVITVTEKYLIEDFFEHMDNRWVGKMYSWPIGSYVALPKAIKRSMPLAIAYPLNISHEIKIALPVDRKLPVDKPLTIKDEHVFYQESSEYSKGALTTKFEYKANRDAVQPNMMPSYTANIQKINKRLGQVFWLADAARFSAGNSGLPRTTATADSREEQAFLKSLTDTIESGTVPKSDLATAFQARGIQHDYLGQTQDALRDFSEAINLDPTYSSAYVSRGVVYEKQNQHALAISDFSKALEIDANNSNAFAQRGISFYYEGKYKDAKQDFENSLNQATKESLPYRLLWLYLATARAGDDGQAALSQAVANQDLTIWPGPAISLFMGEATPEAVLTTASADSKSEKSFKKCEAYFYVAQYYLLKGDIAEAKKYFAKTIDTQVRVYTEHHFATVELNRLANEAPVKIKNAMVQ